MVLLTRKIFENLDTVVAIIVLFEQIIKQILFIFIKYNPFFFAHFRFMLALGVRIILIREIQIMENLYSSKITLKMAGGEDVSPPVITYYSKTYC